MARYVACVHGPTNQSVHDVQWALAATVVQLAHARQRGQRTRSVHRGHARRGDAAAVSGNSDEARRC
jgi:hypothetical protein